MADEKILIEIEVDNKKAVSQLEKQNKEIDELEKNQKDLAKQGKKNTVEYQKQASQLSKLRTERKNVVAGIKTETNSLGRMKTRLREVTLAIDKQNISTVKGRARVKELRGEQKRLNDTLKQSEATGGSFTRNVGNYGDAASGLSPALGGVVQGFTAMRTAALAFLATPIGAVLAAVALAVGSVVAYFKRTEEGGNKLAVAIAYVTSYFESFMDIVSQVGNFLVTYVINNFKLAVNNAKLLALGVKTAFLAIDVAIQKVTGTTEEYEAAQKALADNNKEIIKLGKEQIDIVKETISAGADAIEQTKEEIALATKKAAQSAALQVQENKLVKTKREQLTQNAELNRQIFEGLKLAKDENASYKDREEALKKASAAEQKLADNRLKIAQDEAQIAVDRNNQFDSDAESKQKAAEAEAKVIEAQTASLRTQTKIQSTYLTFQKQKETEQVKEAKRVQGIADLNNDLAVKRIEADIEEATTAQEKHDLKLGLSQQEYELAKLRLTEEIQDKETLEASISNLNFEYAQRNKEIDDELTEAKLENQDTLSDQRKTKAKEEERLQKSVSNAQIGLAAKVFSTVSGFLEKGSAEQKAFAIAEASINTYAGITRALKETTDFTPTQSLRFANAAIVGATGFAQVAKIASTSPAGGGGGGTSIGGGGGGQTQAQPQVDTNPIDQQLAQQEALIAATGNIGMSVSVTEINNVQQDVQLSEQTATI
jgi:hypothetical protein